MKKLSALIQKSPLWFGFLLLLAACGQENTTTNALPAPVQLTVGEGFTNPLGFYEASPRFSWQLPQQSTQNQQSAYQLQVASSDNFSQENLLWDSNKVISNENAWQHYQGKPLNSRQKIFWRVKTWDANQQASKWSEVNTAELGLLSNHDWQAKWIGIESSKQDHYQSLFQPQYLRTNFELGKTIKQARLYITAKGVFKPYLNGQAISEDVMTPGWTPYHKRIETLTYDVTKHLQQGKNTLAATIAEGWHTGRIFSPRKKGYVPTMRLLAQLEVSFTDGTSKVVASDNSWRATRQGPIRAAGNYDGETYDANFEMPSWNNTSFDDSNWSKVYAEPLDLQVQLKPKRHSAVRSTLTLAAQQIVSDDNGTVIYDMGQNMVGVPEITVPVKKGQTIKLRFSEALEHGKFYTKSLRSAKSTDYYTPKQDGIITYRPTFTFHGYRYVELSGFDLSVAPQLNWLKGHVLHSNFAVYNNFASNHDKLNKLSSNVSWGLRGNFLDVPTDCPQRDERLGWTGDAQVFVSTSMYKADVYAFWAAWLESLREDQSIDGMIPKFVPFRQFLTDGTAAAWGDAATIVPWELYQYTGDINVLAENYTMMKRWVQYTEFQSVDFISNIGTYGDWLQPYTTNGRAKGDTHPDLIATAYYARSVDLAGKTARLLGYHTDAEQFEALFEKVKNKFRHYFFDQDLNLVASAIRTIKRDRGKRLRHPQKSEISLKTTQTSYLLPLSFDLFNQQEQQVAVEKLLTLIEQSDRHLRTGFLGTPMLHQVLQRYGHSDVMYDILLKETYPSWFYSINHGATTTWERWNSYSLTDGYNKANMNSLNHYAYGAVAQWFYNGMLGIQATSPGFKTFTVNPQFTLKLNNLSGSVPTINGDIEVSWSIEGNKLTMSLTVPKNSQAQLLLPKVTNLAINKQASTLNSNQALTTPLTTPLTPPLSKSLATPLAPGQYLINGTIEL